jgi:hypothetical protein
VRVGDTLRVFLRAGGTSQWLQPLVSGGGAVVTAPGAASTDAEAPWPRSPLCVPVGRS